MKTKKKAFIALLLGMMFVPATFFTSCENDKNLESVVDESNSKQELQIVVNNELFKELIAELDISRSQDEISDDNIWNVIKNSFQIVKDDETMPVLDYFALYNKDETETKNLVLGKIFLFNNFDDTAMSRANSELSLEDIRNAMMDECEKMVIWTL